MSSSASSSPASSHHHGVFLSNVDDYVAPSQACVNPLFSTTSTEAANNNKNNNGDKREPNANGSADTADTPLSARPTTTTTTRRRRRQRTALVVTEDSNDAMTTTNATPPPQPPKTPSTTTTTTVQASLADCLACSGCVTTTETVLLEEQHSLDILRRRLQGNNNNTATTTVLTLSPASWADLMRHWQLPLDDVPGQQKQRYLRQFTHWLCHSAETAALQIQYVVDGNLPLQWSQQQAADEFCRAYQHKQQNKLSVLPQHQQWQRDAWPSRATARGQLQFVNPQDGTVHDVNVLSNKLPPPSLPLLSGSCPAAVCLVEKTTHKAVPHVTSTVSPMSLAGAWWKRHNNKKIFHVAVMPCHDKKLEASRKDFYDATTQMSDVDLVLTTREFWTLLQEAVQWHFGVVDDDRMTDQMETVKMDIDMDINNDNINNNVEDQLQRAILEAPLASVSQTIPAETNGLGVLLAEELEDSDAKEDVDMVDGFPASSLAPSSSPFVHGSGGYADFIFRYACQHLFGIRVDQVPWEPVTSSSFMDDGTRQQPLRSARVAQRHRQARDFYQATLYRIGGRPDGSFYYSTTRPATTADGTTCEPVLRFATAYGMQTLQRVLKPFDSSPTAASTASPQPHSPFDYIEAMACPSGCLNGGGQVRAASASSLGKETPTETRHRLAQTQRYFATPSTTMAGATATTIPVPPGDRHTTYHVVPPMQLAMGAAAGVAVKDLQW